MRLDEARENMSFKHGSDRHRTGEMFTKTMEQWWHLENDRLNTVTFSGVVKISQSIAIFWQQQYVNCARWSIMIKRLAFDWYRYLRYAGEQLECRRQCLNIVIYVRSDIYINSTSGALVLHGKKQLMSQVTGHRSQVSAGECLLPSFLCETSES